MENMKCDKIKFFQITASGNNLFALDSQGQVWVFANSMSEYNPMTFDNVGHSYHWRKLPMPEEKQ